MQDDRPTARTGDVTQLVVVVGHDRTAVTPSRHLLAGVDEVAIGRGARAAQRDPRRRLLTLRLSDRAMSSAHARLLRVRDRWVLEDAGAKNGVQVNGATVKRAVLLDGDVVEMGSTVFMVRVAPPAHDAIPDLFADGQPVAGLGLPTFNADLATTLDGLARVAGTLIRWW